MIRYEFPRIGNVDSVTVLDTPVTADTAMLGGTLTVKNEAGSPSLVCRAADLISFSEAAYSAGTAHAVNVTLTTMTLVNNRVYSLTVTAPNVINFFGGGRETGAIYQTRTYNVSSGATATVDGIGASFAAAIAADPMAYFTATYTPGTDVLLITAASADAGALVITAPAGAAQADQAAFVAPVGKLAELVAYGISAASVAGTDYHRFIVRHRKLIRSNAVSGLQVFAPVNSLVFIQDITAGDTAKALLSDLLDGSHATNAATTQLYLGCPSV